jgi:hypothetical protein
MVARLALLTLLYPLDAASAHARRLRLWQRHFSSSCSCTAARTMNALVGRLLTALLFLGSFSNKYAPLNPARGKASGGHHNAPRLCQPTHSPTPFQYTVHIPQQDNWLDHRAKRLGPLTSDAVPLCRLSTFGEDGGPTVGYMAPKIATAKAGVEAFAAGTLGFELSLPSVDVRAPCPTTLTHCYTSCLPPYRLQQPSSCPRSASTIDHLSLYRSQNKVLLMVAMFLEGAGAVLYVTGSPLGAKMLVRVPSHADTCFKPA